MTTFTWDNVLSAIREGNQTVPATPNGIPVVAVNAPFYELMQLMEALTTGYNDLVLRDAENQKKIERIRKLAEARFPASQNNTDNWVRVEDRLPGKSGYYFTYGTSLGIYPYKFSTLYEAWNSDDGDNAEHAVDGVTHWYPMPLPPVVAAQATATAPVASPKRRTTDGDHVEAAFHGEVWCRCHLCGKAYEEQSAVQWELPGQSYCPWCNGYRNEKN